MSLPAWTGERPRLLRDPEGMIDLVFNGLRDGIPLDTN